jgi:hypothetical protein
VWAVMIDFNCNRSANKSLLSNSEPIIISHANPEYVTIYLWTVHFKTENGLEAIWKSTWRIRIGNLTFEFLLLTNVRILTSAFTLSFFQSSK